MGAVDFQTKASGKSAREAYKNAVEEANAYSGHQDGYSGDIQTTEGFRHVPSPEAPTLGERLRHARKLAGLKQSEAAEAMRISTTTLSKIERGVPTPRTSLTGDDIDALAAYALAHGSPDGVEVDYRDKPRAFGNTQGPFNRRAEQCVTLSELKTLARGECPASVLNAYVSEMLDTSWLRKWGPCACVTLREPTKGEDGLYFFFGWAAC